MSSPKLTRKFTPTLVALCLSCNLGLSCLAAPPALAFDLGSALGALVGVGAQYAHLDQQVNYISNEGRDEYYQQVRNKVGVNEDPQANAQLTDIMTRLSAAIAQTDPSIKEAPYNYFVNNQTTFNAFCTLGHNLSVNIGLFQMLNYNEDEIAVVVAHELGHGQENHPAESVRQALPLQILVALYDSQNPNALSIVGTHVLANIGTANGITKPMEREADQLAFDYTTTAKFNVGAGAAVWQRVIEKMGDDATNFVSEIFNPSDHPGNAARRDRYNELITQWSRDKVTVNKLTGEIKLKNKTFCTPTATAEMSALERAYLIAGNLAAIYHQEDVSPSSAWLSEEGQLMLGTKAIMDTTSEPAPDTLVRRLNLLK
ncbi:MAG: M48 family metalloprotease [Acidaminococcaceae bacterium]